MENFDWKMAIDGVSMLAKALPKDERLRRWVVIGVMAVVAVAVVASNQCCGSKSPVKKS